VVVWFGLLCRSGEFATHCVAAKEDFLSQSLRSDLAKHDPALLESQSIDLDTRLKAGAVARRFGISTRTLDRWLTKPQVNFPKPDLVLHDVRGRPCVRLWRLGDLIEWERAQAVKHAQAAATSI
jgi:hypothetical protein